MESNKHKKEEQTLQEQYNKLKVDYATLQEQHQKLQDEYSENTIVQSMNDMKQQYERLVSNSVTVSRYKDLQEKYNGAQRTVTASHVLADRILKQLNSIEHRLIYDTKSILNKAHLELIILKEVLDDELKKG